MLLGLSGRRCFDGVDDLFSLWLNMRWQLIVFFFRTGGNDNEVR